MQLEMQVLNYQEKPTIQDGLFRLHPKIKKLSKKKIGSMINNKSNGRLSHKHKEQGRFEHYCKLKEHLDKTSKENVKINDLQYIQNVNDYALYLLIS